MTENITETLYELSLKNVEKFYHSSSRTHIFFQPNIGSLGVKGFGDFANEAYSDYSRKLKAALKKLEPHEINRAISLILEGPRGIEARKEIQIKLPRELKLKLKAKASTDRVSMADLVRQLIDSSLPYTSGDAEILKWQERLKFKQDNQSQSESVARPEEFESVSFRLSEHRMAAVENFADALKVRPAKLLTELITDRAQELEAA